MQMTASVVEQAIRGADALGTTALSARGVVG